MLAKQELSKINVAAASKINVAGANASNPTTNTSETCSLDDEDSITSKTLSSYSLYSYIM